MEIGRIGNIEFQKGYYIYMGSAMNGQLINRVKRHTKPASLKKLHWHIDYFLDTNSTSIIKLFLIPSSYKEECIMANIILSHADRSIKGFGATDCSCPSHLFYFSENNEWIRKMNYEKEGNTKKIELRRKIGLER